MADLHLGMRKVEFSSKIFGGYCTYINLSEYKCTCEIEDHVKALLVSQLSELNLTNLIDILISTKLDIHSDFDELKKQKETETIWICSNCNISENEES